MKTLKSTANMAAHRARRDSDFVTSEDDHAQRHLKAARAGSANVGPASPPRRTARLLGGAGLAVAVLVGGTACSSSAGTEAPGGNGEVETITLSYGIHLREDGLNSVQFRDYIDRVNAELTDYQIELEGFYDGSLCTVQEQLACATDGRLDITMAQSVFAPAELPMTTMTEIPFIAQQELAAALTLRDLYMENPAYEAEFANLNQHVLFFALLPPNVAGFREAVDSLEDFRGMNFRTLGYAAHAFAAVGANPQAIPTAEVWESLERGIVEGFMGGFDFSVGAKFQELTPYWYDMVGINVTAPMVINLDTWDGLPEDVREVMTAQAEASYDTYYEDFAVPAYEQRCTELEGFLDYIGPFDDNKEFAEIAQPAVEEVWIADQQSVLEDPEALLKWYKKSVASYEAELDLATPFDICAEVLG